MRLEQGRIVRRERHLARAAAGARAFGFTWDLAAVEAALDEAAAARPEGAWRTRLLVTAAGNPAVECTPLEHDPDRVWRVALATGPVTSRDRFLRHKTTRREVYDRARAARQDVDDVLLWNERVEITESTIANVVAEIGGIRVTPPLACGLLPGVFRGALLDAGDIVERVVMKAELEAGVRMWLINSLREWIPAELVG